MSVASPVARARPGRDLRLVPVAGLAWVGAAVLVGWPDASGVVLGLAWTTAALCLGIGALLRGRRRVRDVLVIAALGVGGLALVATSVALRAQERAPPGLAEQRGVVDVHIVTAEEVEPGGGRLRGLATSIGSVNGSMPVLLVGASVQDRAGIGAQLRLRGTVSSVGPGGSIVAIVVADGERAEVVSRPPGWLDWGNAMRAGFRALATDLPGDGAALVTGLAIGDDRGVPASLEAAMRTSSLTHLTAVSGANCAIVVGAVMVGGALLGVRRRWRILTALVVLGAFVVLVTPQPSVVRAAVMAAVALFGLALARPMRGLPLLALAIAGILVVDPWASRELGFVLSVLATAGLLVLSGPLGRLLSLALPHGLAAAVAVPLAAQLACAPALALLDASLPTYGVVANLLAIPAAPLATVAGLLACVVALALPGLATGLAWVAWLPSSWIAGVARTLAELPAARLPWPDGIVGVLLHAGLAVVIGIIVLGRGRARSVGAVVLASGTVAYVSALLVLGAVGTLARPGGWQIAMCDVGQGDAAVVRGGDAIAVVDAGPEPAALADCLASLGIARVDLLVLSHFDRDHVGGVAALIGRVDRVLVGPADDGAEQRVLAPLAAGGARIESVRRGAEGQLGGLGWQVLWPPDRPGTEPGNDASVVVRFGPAGGGCDAGECLRSMFLGDLGERAQLALQRMGALAGVDVVKVSHHGSADQSAALYGALGASVGLIGVGRENDYGHPTPQLLGILAATGAHVGRTDEDGLLLVGRDGQERIVVWGERRATGELDTRSQSW